MFFGIGITGLFVPILLILGFYLNDTSGKRVDACYPRPDLSLPQFIIGYGSLMLESSKLKTYPSASKSIPVEVSGYRRVWDAQGDDAIKHSTTFLGIVKANLSTSFNAIIFQVKPIPEMKDPVAAYDSREYWYCRWKVPISQIQFLIPAPLFPNVNYDDAEYWIYITMPSRSFLPDEKHPIQMAYVDTFLAGCLELQYHFRLSGFALQCVTSTFDWGDHWLNDRNGASSYNLPSAQRSTQARVDQLLRQGLPGIYPPPKFQSKSSVRLSLSHLLQFYLIASCLLKWF